MWKLSTMVSMWIVIVLLSKVLTKWNNTINIVKENILVEGRLSNL